MWFRSRFTESFHCRSDCSRIAGLLILIAAIGVPGVFAQDVYLCVWRNPERTMTRIFPDARDYRTVTVKLDEARRNAIESAVGAPLLPGQRDQFQYFEMTAEDDRPIGYIIPVTQKGEFGAVEFVFGLNTDYTLKDLYIQRARERDPSFKQREFLDLFRAVPVAGAAGIGERYNGPETPGTTAVIKGLFKALTEFDLLVLKGV